MSHVNQPLKSAILMARVAGFSYLCYTVAGFYINFGVVPPLSALSGDGGSTDHLEFMFRTGLAAETLLYTFVGISAAAMYVVLRPVGFGAAAIAAFCRLIEAAMGGAFILIKYAAFATATNHDLLPAFSDAQRSSIMGLFGHLYGSAVFFLLIPMAVGGVLFFSLFFRARFIPRWLAAWGMLTYTIIGCVAATVMLFPDLRDHIMLFFLPGALFECVVAVWLLLGGIKTGHWERVESARATAI